MADPAPDQHPRPLPAPPVIGAGGGVLLRRHRPDDAEGILEQCQDPEMQRFTTVPVPYDAADAEGFLRHVATGRDDGTLAAFAVEVDGRFAGTVDLRLQEGRRAEIGFGLHPWARGRGVMTRAVRALTAWGFDELGLQGIEWRAVVGNTASRRVAEKGGFRVEGEVRGLLLHRGERLDGWIGTLLATDPR